MTTTAQELRQLSLDIRHTAQNSPVYSVVSLYIASLCDHINAIARCHEINQEEVDRENAAKQNVSAS